MKIAFQRKFLILTFSAIVAAMTISVRAGTVVIPNASFESPLTIFADPRVDSWQETPKPDGYDETGFFTWDQLVGVFLNTSPTNFDHIDNIDGSQALFIFAIPQTGIFQDYDTMDWSDVTPSHDFDATFETGKSYKLTAGFIGGGGNMTNGVSLEMSLYYRDTSSNKVTVAATNIVYSSAVFSNQTHFIDCQLVLPPVKASDAWAGKKLGVQFFSTVDPALAGGYWDIDNVRLISIRAPILTNPIFTNTQFQMTLLGEPGTRCEILRATNVTLPSANWPVIATVTNSSGTILFTDVNAGAAQNYYRARQLP